MIAGRPGEALVERLLALDAEAVALRGELARRRDASAAQRIGPPARGGIARHAWPLADDPDRSPETLEAYDRRPDDAAIVAARDGAAFLARLDPPGGIRAGASSLRDLARPVARSPEISVIVPVHGQLAWTLNCLDGLLRHASRRHFEIIVIDDDSPDETGTILGELADAIPALRLLRQVANTGFVAACNAGADAARGAMLVFLNNDTRVALGWLDALADSFKLFPNAGLIGSKLLYADGTLQEAGAIIWRDGSAWNVGRGEESNNPSHCHARRADYISGASIAIPAALWRTLGGFDETFAPAYGEDADLAMRVRATGRDVWFQPASLVVHYEGRTGGTDTARGAKSHQVANLKKLFLRWRERLADHGRPGSEIYVERERRVLRRALVVDATTPTPKQDAGSGVTVESIRLLQALGYKVHFVPQDNFLFDPEHTTALQRVGVECGYAPFDLGFDDYIARHGALFDVVMVFRPQIFARIEDALRRHAPQAALVFSNADLHFLRTERQAALSGTPVDARARAEELALITRAPVTMTLSTFERDLIRREAPGARVVLQPFPCAVVGTRAAFDTRRDFVFLGGYGHPPNVDAAVHFVRDIFPLIRRVLPEARIVLAGANPDDEVRDLTGPHVEVTGMIDDLAPLFDAAKVFVCPLRVGAGVKGKVVAAMAHGLPVVATPFGAEGMEIVNGEHLLVADGTAAFAAACVRLYRDSALWTALAAAGLAYVARACSTQAGVQALSEAIDVALQRQLGLEAVTSKTLQPTFPRNDKAHQSSASRLSTAEGLACQPRPSG